MKALKTIAPVLALGLAFAGTAHAQTMDARQACDSNQNSPSNLPMQRRWQSYGQFWL